MIVKNLLVVGAVAGYVSAAAAAEEKANWAFASKIRIDATQSTMDTTVGSGTKVTSKASEVALSYAGFTATSTRGADTLKLELRLENLSGTVGNTLRQANVTHKLNDMVSLTLGKLVATGLSWEYSYDDSDMYMASYIGKNYAPMNMPGAQVGLNFGDHNLSLQVLQGMKTDYAGATYDSKGGLSTTISYSGNIAKMVRPIISYSMIRTAGSNGMMAATTSTPAAATKYTNYANTWGAGVQVEAGGAWVELEMDSVKLLKQKDVTTSKDQDIQSLVAQVKYPVAGFTPFVKFTSDSHKMGADQGVGDYSQTQFALGTEYQMDATCRLHAVYTSKSGKWKGATTAADIKVASNSIILGATASM